MSLDWMRYREGVTTLEAHSRSRKCTAGTYGVRQATTCPNKPRPGSAFCEACFKAGLEKIGKKK